MKKVVLVKREKLALIRKTPRWKEMPTRRANRLFACYGLTAIRTYSGN